MKQQIRLWLVRLERERHQRVLVALKLATAGKMLLPGLRQAVADEVRYRRVQLQLLRYAARSAQSRMSTLRKRAAKFQKLL